MGFQQERDALKAMSQESMKSATELAGINAQRQYQKEQQIFDIIKNPELQSQLSNNINVAKLIWQLKLRTTLLSNVLNKIMKKWPEDRTSFLDIIHRNQIKYENNPPLELINLVEKDVIRYDETIKNSGFDIEERPFLSRAQHAKRSLTQ